MSYLDYRYDLKKLKEFKEKQEAEEIFNQELAYTIYYESTTNTPKQRPYKDNLLTEKNFISSKNDNDDTDHLLKTNYIRTDRHSCLITDLNELKQILLKDMFLNHIHSGCFIELQTIAQPYYVSGMHLLAKDSNGDFENLILFNYESNLIDPNMIIPIGTKLIVKEPHLQMFNHTDFGIRVDSPTNVNITSYPEYELSINKSVDELVIEGNYYFTKSQFYIAIRYYTKAIDKSLKTCLRAYLNRSESYFKLEKYYSAYQDAKYVVNLEKNNFKAHFSLAKSAYLLKKFEIALESFQSCLKLDPDNEDVQIELKKTNQRINESKYGNYNLESIYEQYFEKNDFNMDIADFKSNKITIKDIENKSKGVVAVDFIRKGTLLLVSKASSAVFHNQIDYRQKSYNSVDYMLDIYKLKNETENISKLVYKMQDDPEFASNIYSLYAGPNFDRNSQVEHPLIDIKRIEAIYEFNSFQIKNSLQVLELIELEKEFKKLKNYNEQDFNEIDLTSIDFESNEFKYLAEMQVKYDNLSKQSGLWYLSSLFNHSCCSNAIMQTIGDMMMFYSIKNIQKDEEITISYFPPEWDYNLKIERSIDVYGFKCDCKLCEMDENDPMRIERDNLLKEIQLKNMNQIVSIDESIMDLERMKKTYLNRPEARCQLIKPLEILAVKYRMDLEYQNSAKCFEEAFDIIKDYNDFLAITMLKECYFDYKKSSQTKKCQLIEKKATEYFESISLNKLYYEKLWEKNVSFLRI